MSRGEAITVLKLCTSLSAEFDAAAKRVTELSDSFYELEETFGLIKYSASDDIKTFCLRKMLEKATSFTEAKRTYDACSSGSNVQSEAIMRMLELT